MKSSTGTAAKVFFVSNVWPEPDSSAAGRHMLQLLESLHRSGAEIVFGCTSAPSAFMSETVRQLCRLEQLRMNCSSFDTLVKQLKPDIVVFDRFMAEEQFGWRVRDAAPDAACVLNTEDLHFIRRWRGSIKPGNDYSFTEMSYETFQTDDARRELASIFRCDLSLLMSEAEVQILSQFMPQMRPLLHYHPLCESASDVSDPLQQDLSFNCISLGNFLHKPNQDAVQVLIQEIWPALRRELSGAELHLFGAYATEKTLRWSQPHNGIQVIGRAADLTACLNGHRLLLAPIRFGAGLKGKLLDAMRHGLPFVTTPIGIEGIDEIGNCPDFVAINRDDFIRKAAALYHDDGLRKKFRLWAAEVLRNKFDAQQHETSLLSQLSQLKRDLPQIREKNITGGILRHHTTASTRYMGKWIEEKNRRSESP